MKTVLLVVGVAILIKAGLDIIGYYLVGRYCRKHGFKTDGVYVMDEHGCYIQYIDNPFMQLLTNYRKYEYEKLYKLTIRALGKVIH